MMLVLDPVNAILEKLGQNQSSVSVLNDCGFYLFLLPDAGICSKAGARCPLSIPGSRPSVPPVWITAD